MRALALLRIAAGPVTLLHLRPFLEAGRDGRIYRDTFYEPYASWYPELPRGLYVALLWVGAVAASTMALGLLSRLSTAVTFGVVAYNLFLSTTHMHNNRAYLLVVLGMLALAPCGRELSLDAWIRARRGLPPLDPYAPGWPLWLLRMEAAAVYGASGFNKLVDRDWLNGTVTWDRVMHQKAHLAAHTPLPDWAISVLANRTFHTFAGKVIVCAELFIAIGLWARVTRYAAVWVAVLFHLSIEVTSSVQVFSYLGIAALVIWAVPSTRDRVLHVDTSTASGRRLAANVRALDWLARFRIEPAPRGRPARVIDRDGTERSGRDAVVLVCSRLPLTAFFALPTLAFARKPGKARIATAS
jgi:HTTM domain